MTAIPSTGFAPPILFASELEDLREGEVEYISMLEADLRRMQEIVAREGGVAARGLHAKAHGIVRGKLRIHADLSPSLAQGLFSVPGEHAALLRFSTNPGDLLDDAISVPRGLALKLFDVAGERLPDTPESDTQDLLFANGPVFGAADAKAFHRLLRVLALTTNRGESAKKLLSKGLGRVQTALTAVGHRSRLLNRLGGEPNVHPLGETYFSQTAFRYGRYVAKFRLEPDSGSLKALAGKVIGLAMLCTRSDTSDH